MKIFNSNYQNKILNLLLLIYTSVAGVYIGFAYLNDSKSLFPFIEYCYILLAFSTLVLLLFRKQVGLISKTIGFTLILIISGLAEIYFTDDYKGYLYVMMAFLMSSFVLKQSQVFVLFIGATIGIIGISALSNMGHPDTFLSVENIKLSWPKWLEKINIFVLLSFFTTLALTSLKKHITKLIFLSTQEKIKYKPLFDQTYSFISMLDNTGHVIESNQAALYFIQSTNSEVKNIYFPDTKWWNYNEKVKDEITINLQSSLNGDFRRFEITHQNTDGEIEFFDYTLKPVFDDLIGVKYIIAEGRNITEFKRARQALIEGEERLLALTESTYEGLIISNAGVIIEANRSALKLFQLTKHSEIIGQIFHEVFIHPDEKAIVLEKINENFTKPFETRAITKNGSSIPIEIEGRDIIYKGKLHRVSAIRDLSERRLAQKALINSEEKYRLITENIIDIICKLDESLKFTYASSSVYNMLGYTVNEMGNISIQDITTRESYHKIISFLNGKKRLLKSNAPDVWASVAFEAVLKHKSGKLLWTHLSAKLIKWGKNNTYEILCVARNIDALKKIQFSLEENENRLKQQNEEYERLNIELTNLNEKLFQAKHKAEESDNLKSAFLANMSHEIRTPMNSIIGFSRMFKSPEIDEDKRIKYADFVVNNGMLLLNIVNDILDLSKIESGQIQLKLDTFNLNELIDELFRKISDQNNKGLMIQRSKSLEDTHSYIYSDRSRLYQVLWNLINNAYKFTKKGAIKIGYQLINGSILFFVEDTGIGIPSEQQEKIFERFRQVEMEASRVFGGAGLGLSISQKMVELMKGKIWLKSQAGIGSTFYVSIPLQISEKQSGQAILPIHEKPSGIEFEENLSILIAEDDESNYYYLHELLSGLRFNIIRAKNGVEAVEICKTDPSIRLVFMDIKMPIMDGFQATQEIKQAKPLLPVIAQTAFAMADDKEAAILQGCDDYLSKPIDPQILLAKIKKYMFQ
ncbi:MAG: PAS domain S-box protein [Prolixibacteraceae bacterium]